MNDNMEELLSGIFREEKLPETQSEFTYAVMKKLPKQEIPSATRNGILLCILMVSSIPLFTIDFMDLYAWVEDLAVESMMTLEYWIEELNVLA